MAEHDQLANRRASAVTEVAFGKTSLLRSARAAIPKLVCGPDRILLSRPFGSMFLLYAGTYITANTVDTVSSSADEVRAGASTSSLTKLGLVSTVNVGLSLAKDNQFAKAFGAASTRSMPLISYGPLMLRDAITLYASFNLPPLIADLLPVSWEGFMSRLAVAQLAAPAASQLVTTPLHLYGLDTANRRGKLSFRRRWDPIQKAWASTSAARALRVLPGLGLGNVVNTQVRTDLMARIHS